MSARITTRPNKRLAIGTLWHSFLPALLSSPPLPTRDQQCFRYAKALFPIFRSCSLSILRPRRAFGSSSLWQSILRPSAPPTRVLRCLRFAEALCTVFRSYSPSILPSFSVPPARLPSISISGYRRHRITAFGSSEACWSSTFGSLRYLPFVDPRRRHRRPSSLAILDALVRVDISLAILGVLVCLLALLNRKSYLVVVTPSRCSCIRFFPSSYQLLDLE